MSTEENIPATHQQQITEGVRDSLIRAGIGPRYHEQKLTDFKPAAPVMEWLKTHGKAKVRNGGEGVSLIGDTPHTYTAFVLLARTLHMSGIGVRIITTAQLALKIDDAWDPALDDHALFLTGFYEPRGSGECPFAFWQRQRVEDYLRERADHNRATFLLLARKEGIWDWWSRRILELLPNSEIEVR